MLTPTPQHSHERPRTLLSCAESPASIEESDGQSGPLCSPFSGSRQQPTPWRARWPLPSSRWLSSDGIGRCETGEVAECIEVTFVEVTVECGRTTLESSRERRV